MAWSAAFRLMGGSIFHTENTVADKGLRGSPTGVSAGSESQHLSALSHRGRKVQETFSLFGMRECNQIQGFVNKACI